LKAIYPERFPTTVYTNAKWNDIERRRAFFDKLVSICNIQKPEDWKKVTAVIVKKEGGSFVYGKYGSLRKGMSK
jgi:hypothetical protein